MKASAWLGGLAALVTFMTVVGSGGCGSDVATCTTVCALPGATGSCPNDCGVSQTATAAVGASGDFQAYLTCLENAGTYSAVDGICAPIAQTVATETASAIGSGAVTGDSGVSSCSGATCDTACALAYAPSDCQTFCAMAQTECATGQAQFQALLECLCEAGEWITGAKSGTACAMSLVALDQECSAFDSTGGDAG